MSGSGFFTVFRPTDESLSPGERSRVQAHRLLFLLGAVLGILFIPLYEISNPEATSDPVWGRIAVAGCLAGVFVASYLSKRVRRTFSFWVWGTITVIIGWFIVVTALNDFASDYEIGLLLLHSIFTVIAGIGARSIWPVLGFTSASFFATLGAVLIGTTSLVEEAVLLGSMATVSLVLAVAIRRLVSTREQLRERQSRLRGLANSIPGVVFQFYGRPDGSRGNYFVSEHAEEMLRVSADPDGFHERVLERVPSPYRERALESIEAAVAERTNWRFEVPFDKPSGERIWLLGTSAPQVRDEEIVFNGFLLDITERKAAENELQRTKNRYQTLVENFPRGAVFLFDENLTYTLAGGAELEELGISPSELEGRAPSDLFPRGLAEELEAYYRRALEGEVHVFERQYQGKHYQVLTLPVQGSDGEVVSGMTVALDVTAQKRQERELREAKQRAEEASRVKTAMLANMSHEVRTPLTSIIGFSEVLKDNLEGRLERFARRTHESSERLSQTLKSILQLSKLEAGVETLEREDVSIVETTQEIVELLQPRADEKNITVQTFWPDGAVSGHWNENALRRIARNLLENAVKFTPEGGTVQVRVVRDAESVVLEVEDTGIGIREDLLPDVFQAFRQESEGLERKYQGSGLGLSIVDHLVEELGGTIDVDTEKGEGTCFAIRLPLEDDEASSSATSSEATGSIEQ